MRRFCQFFLRLFRNRLCCVSCLVTTHKTVALQLPLYYKCRKTHFAKSLGWQKLSLKFEVCGSCVKFQKWQAMPISNAKCRRQLQSYLAMFRRRRPKRIDILKDVAPNELFKILIHKILQKTLWSSRLISLVVFSIFNLTARLLNNRINYFFLRLIIFFWFLESRSGQLSFFETSHWKSFSRKKMPLWPNTSRKYNYPLMWIKSFYVKTKTAVQFICCVLSVLRHLWVSLTIPFGLSVPCENTPKQRKKVLRPFQEFSEYRISLGKIRRRWDSYIR